LWQQLLRLSTSAGGVSFGCSSPCRNATGEVVASLASAESLRWPV